MRLLPAALTSLLALAAEAFAPRRRPAETTRSASPGTALRVSASAEPPSTVAGPAPEIVANYRASPRWRKRTKQLATLGPASESPEMMEKLFLAGADVFRLNFSHGDRAEKRALLEDIRALEKKYYYAIGILGDLQGPKLRVGTFANPGGEFLEAGSTFRFDLLDEEGTGERVRLPHPEIIEASEVGHSLLVDDGKVKLEVTGKGDGYLDCEVKVEGYIKDRKGVNTPDSILSISCLTPKDREDLKYMLSIGVDWVALSFVQRPEDIVEIKRLIAEESPETTPRVMAKIEKPSCFLGDNLERIIDLCDGIMVARGDLGVESAPEDVPILQKEVIGKCRSLGKPVIVATQMLESMIESPTPTRAEASDAATAIYDGADGVMLSGESAVGKYPVESVAMQQKIITRVENDPQYAAYTESTKPEARSASAVMGAASFAAGDAGAACIASFTVSGDTARTASRMRPNLPILALSPCLPTCRQLTMSWGVYTKWYGGKDVRPESLKDLLFVACDVATKKGLVSEPEDKIVVTAGFPFGVGGPSNLVSVIPASGPQDWKIN